MRTDTVVDFDNPDEVADYVNYVKQLKGVHIIHHQDKTDQRSISLNNYYWGVVIKYISQDTGATMMELHRLFKNMFIPHVIFTDEFDLRTSKNCDQEAMWDYCQLIRSYIHLKLHTVDSVSKRGRQFYIPDPYSVIRVAPEEKVTPKQGHLDTAA